MTAIRLILLTTLAAFSACTMCSSTVKQVTAFPAAGSGKPLKITPSVSWSDQAGGGEPFVRNLRSRIAVALQHSPYFVFEPEEQNADWILKVDVEIVTHRRTGWLVTSLCTLGLVPAYWNQIFTAKAALYDPHGVQLGAPFQASTRRDVYLHTPAFLWLLVAFPWYTEDQIDQRLWADVVDQVVLWAHDDTRPSA